jgi:hypothetical protein
MVAAVVVVSVFVSIDLDPDHSVLVAIIIAACDQPETATMWLVVKLGVVNDRWLADALSGPWWVVTKRSRVERFVASLHSTRAKI